MKYVYKSLLLLFVHLRLNSFEYFPILCNKNRTQLCNIIKFSKNKENCGVKIQQIIFVLWLHVVWSIVDYCRHKARQLCTTAAGNFFVYNTLEYIAN